MATPALSDGRMYVRSNAGLFAVAAWLFSRVRAIEA